METTRLPKDLPDAMRVLDGILSEEDKNIIRNFTEWEAASRLHFTLGHWIRNQWIYNSESPLREVLRKMEVLDDDKSGLILKLYYRHLSGVELNWEEELADLDPMERIRRRRQKEGI